MHSNIKRALAMSAMVPFALTTVAGSAGAVSIRAAVADVQKDGSRITATCEFTNQTYFQVYVDLKGTGLGPRRVRRHRGHQGRGLGP